MKSKAIILLSVVLLFASITLFTLNIHLKGNAESLQNGDQDLSPSLKQDIQAMNQTATKRDDVQDQVEKAASELLPFLEQWERRSLSKSGWLHMKSQVNQEGLGMGNLPDGSSRRLHLGVVVFVRQPRDGY